MYGSFFHLGLNLLIDFCEQVNNGFLEGVIRGYRSGILTNNQYANLAQCETLEGKASHRVPFHSFTHMMGADFRTQLSATDYGNFLANEPSPLSTSTIADKATQVLVDQFNYLRNNAVQPLSKFLEYITYISVFWLNSDVQI